MNNKPVGESNQKNNSHERTDNVNHPQYYVNNPEQLKAGLDFYPSLEVKESALNKSNSPLLKALYNFPIRTKQILASVVFQAISTLGIGALGGYLIISSVRTQLEKQASSEVEMLKQSYLIKINQMAFGSKGQSDNPAIINLAAAYQEKNPLNPELQKTVKQILKNESKTRKIEYAVLVGRDFKVIANANKETQGKTLNPDNLVAEAISKNSQIKANSIVSWKNFIEQQNVDDKLSQLEGKDLLVRFVVTPLKDPVTSKIIGALIFGDVANSKPLILNTAVAATAATGGGYNGIYYRQRGDGEYVLATSIFSNNDKLTSQVALPSTSIVNEAIDTQQTIIKRNVKVNDIPLTLAAKSIPNIFEIIRGEQNLVSNTKTTPIAVLVRGTPETSINELLSQSLQTGLLVVLSALLLNGLLAYLLGQIITGPIKKLQESALKFMQGDRQARAKVEGKDEIGQVTATFNELAETIQASELEQIAQAKRKELLARIAQSNTSEQLISPLGELLEEVKIHLKADRVVVYRFLPDWQGYIAGEAVNPPYPIALGTRNDPCINQELREFYLKGRMIAAKNVYEMGYHPDHVKLLQALEIKSNLIVPIAEGEQLFGLLIAHQCKYFREWSNLEQLYLADIADSIAPQLYSLALLERKQAEAEREQQQNGALQNELFKLLTDVEGAASGDLTVRAQITSGQIGIVADFFNSIIESLREIVSQVKSSAGQVNSSVGENETIIRGLADEAILQANQITTTLSTMEEMNLSIQKVALSASSAAGIARSASKKVEVSGTAMDDTVKSIIQLRQTVAETAKKMKRLGESSQKISRVASLINQISLKTNLLAVNASIEASRAGEDGRGFAVVAEEIGQLATQSAEATKEVEQIVGAIQRETSEVIDAMETGTSQVVEGSKTVQVAKQSLGEIIELSRNIDQLLQSISVATLSQQEKSQIVTQLMDQVAQVAQKTSLASKGAASSLQETVAIAEKLQASVGTFNITG